MLHVMMNFYSFVVCYSFFTYLHIVSVHYLYIVIYGVLMQRNR